MFYLTCASLVGAFTLLIISLLDLGVFSLWVNPPLSLITLLYHAAVLLLSQRKRTPENPSYFSTVVFVAYIIALVWLAAFIITVVVLVVYKNDYTPTGLQRHGLPVTDGTQRIQVFLTFYELVMVGGIGAIGHLKVIAEGDPDTWRPRYREPKDEGRKEAVDYEPRPYTYQPRPVSYQAPPLSPTIPVPDEDYGQHPNTSFVNA